MAKYLIIKCQNCKRPSLASEGKKTRSCPYCGKPVKITYDTALSSMMDASSAREILQRYKESLRHGTAEG